jgi:hypothetical protein
MASVSLSLLNALDMRNANPNNHTKMQLGENNHPEYGWSTELRTIIVQYYSQLNESASTNEFTMDKLSRIYRDMIAKSLAPEVASNPEGVILITAIYKIIANTRDIIAGKGIYGLTYMMISGWALHAHSIKNTNISLARFCNTLATSALKCLVIFDTGDHPLGSWKDIKYFCNYWKQVSPYTSSFHDPMIQTALSLICNQLSHDAKTPLSTNRSLVAKWIPREKSKKFGWLTKELAYSYFNTYLTDTNTHTKSSHEYQQAKKKCLTEFRKLVASINKTLDTTQIKQCQNEWANINFEKGVTSITLRKQSHAFQNKTKNNVDRTQDTFEKETDRNVCAAHYKSYVEMCAEKPEKAKGKNVSMVDFVRSALEVSITNNAIEKSIINSQWINNSLNTGQLENMIAMVDTSGSMESDNSNPLYSAIGLGIRVAEKSTFGKRVMTFSATPEWVNLDDCDNFVDSVKKIRYSPWGMNTNFRAALDLILEAAITNDIEPQKMEDMTLAIFSDMQIDQATQNHNHSQNYSQNYSPMNNQHPSLDTMFEMMRKKYKQAGLQSKFAVPYKLPHILFWNLRSNDGFPNLSVTKNTSMLSGSSANSLNLFTNKGINGLREITPWNMMMESLSHERYNELDETIKRAFTEQIYS